MTLPNLYIKRPITISAAQWFKNGDHPEDNATEMFDYPDGFERPSVVREGLIVRYYRHPRISGDSLCEQCGAKHDVHGWIDTLEQGHRVCPGDWIITGVAGERYPCKPAIFEKTYSIVELAGTPPPSQEYAELPEPNSYCTYSDSHEYDVFDAEQMHAYADATHALRTGGKP